MNKKKPEIQDYPKVGDECYLRQYTSDYFINASRRPYAVLFALACCVVAGRCSEQEELRNRMAEYEKTF